MIIFTFRAMHKVILALYYSLSLDLSILFAIFSKFYKHYHFTPSPFRSIINNMNISAWLIQATKRLKDIGIASARLDAELLLANTLRRERTYLHAHLDEPIDPRRLDIAEARLDLRLDRVPLAYILGYKEFYGRRFTVTPSVLVPRPESEDMITLLLTLTAEEITPKTLIDVGTGSGCLGITAKCERPEWRVILTDMSADALKIAAKNAEQLGVNVTLEEQSLLTGHIEPLDYIIANLPYVDPAWETSPELRHEPHAALYAPERGLALINRLIDQAPHHLATGGLILLEADPQQHEAIIQHAQTHGFTHEATRGFIVALRLVATER